jgi:hypothetical protein
MPPLLTYLHNGSYIVKILGRGEIGGQLIAVRMIGNVISNVSFFNL